ncbi:hypothetical protein EV702DRAFT_948980, partial [Suillus placidus]
PTIGQDIGIQEDQLQWLASAYSLRSECLLFFGRIADLYGRKKPFIFGSLFQLIFLLGGSFANGKQRSVQQIRMLQRLQRPDPQSMTALTLTPGGHAFPLSRARSIAFSTLAAGAPTGGAFGTMVVGSGTVTQLSKFVLTSRIELTERGQHLHWRVAFYVAAAFSAMCCIGALISFYADEKYGDVDRNIDWIGAILVASGLVFTVFVLGQGSLMP